MNGDIEFCMAEVSPFLRELFQDVIKQKNVKVFDYDDIFRNGALWYQKIVFRLYRFLPFTRKMLWTMYRQFGPEDRNSRCIFLYFGQTDEMVAKTGLIDRLRKKYPNSYHVDYFLDVAIAKRLDYEYMKKKYNKIYIMDKDEAVEMGIYYFPDIYSKNEPDIDESEEIYDVSFIGQAKGRYEQLMSVYDYLESNGLKCHFYICGVEKNDRRPRKGIVYADEFLYGDEYFDYVKTAKCLLEAMLPDTTALTSRVREAIAYDKKIISVNSKIKELEYYNDDMMFVYSKPEDIDIDFFKRPKRKYNYGGEWSPIHFFEQLERDYCEWEESEKRG